MAVLKHESNKTEYELFSEYRRTKDKAVRDEIVNSYIYIAEILSRKFINRGVDYDDIFQVACIGILYAMDRFDPDRGIKFATFATPTVLGEIRNYFRDKGNFIRIPRHLYEVFYKAERIKRASTGHDTSIKEVARILELPGEALDKLYSLRDSAFKKSLEDEAFAEGSTMHANVIGRDDDHFMMIENRDFVESCLKSLNERERQFVQFRYYEEKSQKQIADIWGVSQMMVSRTERKILEKFKRMYFKD